ncbi:hypothetical protein HW272_05075 [Peptostreptococcaceae bacterium oral taxon 081]|nr:hypothetical protein [Peptostreptococcaceae bacterium oral taxon 081]
MVVYFQLELNYYLTSQRGACAPFPLGLLGHFPGTDGWFIGAPPVEVPGPVLPVFPHH